MHVHTEPRTQKREDERKVREKERLWEGAREEETLKSGQIGRRTVR